MHPYTHTYTQIHTHANNTWINGGYGPFARIIFALSPSDVLRPGGMLSGRMDDKGGSHLALHIHSLLCILGNEYVIPDCVHMRRAVYIYMCKRVCSYNDTCVTLMRSSYTMQGLVVMHWPFDQHTMRLNLVQPFYTKSVPFGVMVVTQSRGAETPWCPPSLAAGQRRGTSGHRDGGMRTCAITWGATPPLSHNRL